ncbi:MarR family 2-MHQ and catechol resistance regulon transcriptional repressor [Salsuginibacillus halophilus]|uniref:MarR family 2-MHQ and catechol resistance regulon transcriptional repressor n=1 Tax=Salsuginibacillus halophilus TaxID=517424 RepID=A0A2P8HXW6_9BACI|nr:MarR family transcriptional regulator [Salsuginibacillus halophilus]PSL51004.1 MarR family 2-MHQ and catechol resistance regulon transcriptional repressor [Salsuginibacillus halophilus]
MSSPEPSSLKLWIVLSRAHQSVLDEVKQDIKHHNMNLTEFAVMELLHHKGPQQIQHIGAKILISSGSITYVVDKLEKKGWLYRKPCDSDRRVIYTHITDEGARVIDEMFPEHEKRIEEIFSALSSEEQEHLYSLLKKVGFSLTQSLE